MKKRKLTPNKSLKRLREILGITQQQFAAMLGVSLDTIGSVEIGRNQLTRKLNARIMNATGATLLNPWALSYWGGKHAKGKRYSAVPWPDGEVRRAYWTSDKDSEYTCEIYEQHLKQFASTPANAKQRLKEALPNLEKLFLAAGKPGPAGMRHRLPALCYSLNEWIAGQNRAFRLGVKFSYVETETNEE